ncbi:hypothetical protein [Nitrolancea hollandica]|uniref:Histidine kinase N-terminal 7TM region domain-containing protein n=1 Tax=Nitrolancea hollandica Lb TaxID=1129897 RepID=I4ELP2_9BACT|nr:hypothetical protein [Nitrolancea hollandica]CCF85604.1 conserved membrane hypothetical protein [Nitrolancea hollandica Lb]
MFIFPLVAAIISVACFATVAFDYVRRPKPDKLIWSVAFALFGYAVLSEIIGATLGWTGFLARSYFVSGAILVVGYLALGELFLIARRPVAWGGLVILGILSVLSIVAVAQAPVAGDLGAEGWRALDRSGLLLFLAIFVNTVGTLILVGGALWSAYRFRRLGTMRNRMLGCIAIAIGTLTTASGGVLTRLGNEDFLYISMAIGIAVIYWGYLLARAPARAVSGPVRSGRVGSLGK